APSTLPTNMVMIAMEGEEERSTPTLQQELLQLLRDYAHLPGVFWRGISGTDVRIVTSCRKSIPAHSAVLASASPVLENALQRRPRKRGNAEKAVVPVLGVPYKAVVCFLRCLYTSRFPEDDEERSKYGVHLLVLSHVMRVPWLKRAAVGTLASSLTTDNVVDMLQLARQCDAPCLRLRCMALLRREFKAVEKTEGWRFVRDNDPYLELEVLQFLQEEDKRERRRMRSKEERRVYMELSEAMECLRHICTEGCTCVGPKGVIMEARKGPCEWGRTCEGVQQLIQHFATCEKKKNRVPGGGCRRCGRMWQLLRLHSAICEDPELCNVPLCKQFKGSAGGDKKKVDDMRWSLLAKKVVSAKVMCSLSKRRGDADDHDND
ncbi:BTB/POZ and TAZ domain-containing protein, partial [Escherichia coli]|uniref:BTB/POZ and TAZ domain-containing protein n=1 Tax=Escherichia coli TaxID=562 RepID=UPI003B9D951B